MLLSQLNLKKIVITSMLASISCLQLVQNAVARPPTRICKCEHITPVPGSQLI